MKKAEVAKEVEGLFGSVPDWMGAFPESAVGDVWGMFKNVELQKSAIPNKYNELIGLAVAATSKCRYCILFHTEAAKANGATDDEIAETAFLARFTTGWSAILHAANIDFDKFKQQFAQVGEYLSKQAKH